METSEKLARSSKLTNNTALNAAYRKKSLHPFLRENRSLPEDLWFKLYTHRPKISVSGAASLVARELSEQQIDYVLSSETRVRPLSLLVSSSELNLEQHAKVFAMKNFSPEVAGYWVYSGRMHPDFATRIALKAGGSAFLKWLAKQTYETIPAEKAIELFAQWAGWTSRIAEDGALEDLLYQRPELFETYVSHPNWLVRAAAASSSLMQGLEVQEKLVNLAAGQATMPHGAYSQENQRVLEKLVLNPNLNLSLAETIARISDSTGIKASCVTAAARRVKLSYPNIESPWETLTEPWQVEAVGEYATTLNERSVRFLLPLWSLGPIVGNQHLVSRHFHSMARKIAGSFGGTPIAEKFRIAYGEEVYNTYFSSSEDEVTYNAGRYRVRSVSDKDPNPQMNVETVRNTPVAFVPYQGQVVISYIEAELGSNEKAWEVFWNLCDDYDDNAGNLGELLDICQHI